MNAERNEYAILSVEELLYDLKQKGRKHKVYYHYTTWDSFKKIYENKSFLLTRGNSLSINDQHEALMKGSYRVWNKTYIGSFSFGSSENMAMWGLYGQPSDDAIRISIPQSAMIAWVDSIRDIYTWNGKEKRLVLPGSEITLTDIVYASGENGGDNLSLYYARRKLSTDYIPALHGVDRDKRMTGYIKNSAWQYENEVRLRIQVPDFFREEKIMIDIPQNVLDEMQIMKGPCFEGRSDPLYIRLKEEGRLEESAFTNLLKYRSLCDYCKYSFMKKSEI